MCHYKNLQINPLYGQVSQLSGQIRSYCEKMIRTSTNRIGVHKDVPVAALRRCAKSRYLYLSYHIAKSCLRVEQIVSQCTNYEPVVPNAPLCHNLLSGQIRSYCKTPIACRINRIVMPLRRCVIRRRRDKSDRIGVETCYVFHCAAM